jgi:hypothetical protein
MEYLGVPVHNCNLEDWLKSHDSSQFPSYRQDKGEKAYPERYKEIKDILYSIHEKVENGALLASAVEWKKKATEIIIETTGVPTLIFENPLTS